MTKADTKIYYDEIKNKIINYYDELLFTDSSSDILRCNNRRKKGYHLEYKIATLYFNVYKEKFVSLSAKLGN